MGNKRLANGNLELQWERFGISNKKNENVINFFIRIS